MRQKIMQAHTGGKKKLRHRPIIEYLQSMDARVVGPASALAHHSAAMFESEKTIAVTGTMKEFEYVNPHAWLYVVVADDKGEGTLWGFEAEGPSALMRAGIKKNSLQPGDLVTVTARPLRDGRPAGAWVSVTKTDGTVLAPRAPAARVSAPPN
jgi:hypothetical protein